MGHRFQLDKTVELLKPIPILVVFFLNCTRPAPQPISQSGDSLQVDSGAAVFFQADSLRLIMVKAALKDRTFESLTHDCNFEMKYARSIIQRTLPALPVVMTSANRWLVFKKKNGTRKRIDLNTITDICGVFLFDGIRDPVRANMPNMDTELWNYFGHGRE